MSFFDDFLGITDPGASALFGGLFGGGSGSDTPAGANYYIKDGKVYRTDFAPNQAGVPLSGIPGTDPRPTSKYYTMADQIRAIQDLMPYYTKSVTDELSNVANAELKSAQTTSPQYAQLMTELYRQYGPQLNQIGSDIAKQNALNQASQDSAVIAGPGGELVRQAYDLSQVYDKPYYDTRALTSGRLGDLMNSIDLSGGLSAVERREIEQSLALQGGRRGTYNAPSSTDTVGNAMQYGQAGRARVVENQNQLSKAIAASAAFLPAAKSGVDVFQVATGRPSVPNTGESKFTGVNETDPATATNLANGLLGTSNANAANASAWDINAANIKANEKDWLDKFVQFTQGIGNVASAATSVAGVCWVAREVYGANNPKWIKFRDWLATDAPTWFFKLYVKHGEKFAKWVSNKPKLKFIIRMWMNTKTK